MASLEYLHQLLKHRTWGISLAQVQNLQKGRVWSAHKSSQKEERSKLLFWQKVYKHLFRLLFHSEILDFWKKWIYTHITENSNGIHASYSCNITKKDWNHFFSWVLGILWPAYYISKKLPSAIITSVDHHAKYTEYILWDLSQILCLQ